MRVMPSLTFVFLCLHEECFLSVLYSEQIISKNPTVVSLASLLGICYHGRPSCITTAAVASFFQFC